MDCKVNHQLKGIIMVWDTTKRQLHMYACHVNCFEVDTGGVKDPIDMTSISKGGS